MHRNQRQDRKDKTERKTRSRHRQAGKQASTPARTPSFRCLRRVKVRPEQHTRVHGPFFLFRTDSANRGCFLSWTFLVTGRKGPWRPSRRLCWTLGWCGGRGRKLGSSNFGLAVDSACCWPREEEKLTRDVDLFPPLSASPPGSPSWRMRLRRRRRCGSAH
jgi:hypothetical protein